MRITAKITIYSCELGFLVEDWEKGFFLFLEGEGRDFKKGKHI